MDDATPATLPRSRLNRLPTAQYIAWAKCGLQLQAQKKVGCEEIFREKTLGATRQRLGFNT